MKSFLIPAVFAVFFFACSSSNNNDSNCPEGTAEENGECRGVIPSPNGDGAYLALPNNASSVQDMYNKWISTYYTTYEEDKAKGVFVLTPDEAEGTARIKATYSGAPNDGSNTASEAIGYGMILTSLMEDWTKFDKLFAYSKVWRYKIDGNQTALMRWSINNFTSGNGGSATDADIDIMASLFIAYKKTNNSKYLEGALEIGASIWNYEVDASTRLVLPAANNEAMGKGQLYNISYISLPALGMLKKYDTSRDWGAVLEKNINYMQQVQNAGDGLWPDWSDAGGAPANPNNGSSDNLTASDGSSLKSHETYYKEAVRIPWRIAWYYHWFGDPRAKAMLDKGMALLKNKGVSSSQDLKNFYSYTGGKEGKVEAGVSTWASLCALGLGNSANMDWVNACNSRATGFYNPSVTSYYPNSLHIIYSMLFNGKF